LELKGDLDFSQRWVGFGIKSFIGIGLGGLKLFYYFRERNTEDLGLKFQGLPLLLKLIFIGLIGKEPGIPF